MCSFGDVTRTCCRCRHVRPFPGQFDGGQPYGILLPGPGSAERLGARVQPRRTRQPHALRREPGVQHQLLRANLHLRMLLLQLQDQNLVRGRLFRE